MPQNFLLERNPSPQLVQKCVSKQAEVDNYLKAHDFVGFVVS